MDYKRSYTREDLTRTTTGRCGYEIDVCRLCDAESYEGDTEKMIFHDQSCPLAWDAVLAIKGIQLTAPREAICGQCAAKDRPCVVEDWRASTHQELMKACGRYAVDDGRIE